MTKDIYELRLKAAEARAFSSEARSLGDFRDKKDENSGIEITGLSELNHLHVGKLQAKYLDRLVAHTDPTSHGADRFRLLRMRLWEIRDAGALKSLLVTSPFPGDGKTTVALNLATTLAQENGKSVLLIDADLHRGSIDDQLALQRHAGLSECLRDGINPMSVIRRVEPLGWHLLSSGKVDVRSPAELLQPERISRVAQQLTSLFDWVIFDCPPVLAISDALLLLPHVDGSLLVVRAGVTSVRAVEDALDSLGRKHVKGVLLSGIKEAYQPYSAYYKYQAADTGR